MSGVVIAETVRRCVTSVWFGGFVAFVAIASLGVSRFNAAGAVWPTLASLLAFVIGCTPIGPEFSSGTLQLILTKPLKRWVYLLSRVAGVVLVVWMVTLFAFACELLGRALWGDGSIPVDTMAVALIHSMADTLLICALLVLLGSLTRAYFNVAIYFTVMIVLSISEGILGMMRPPRVELQRAVSRVSQFLFPDPPPRFDEQWLLLVLVNATVALILACAIFRRREVPYGAD